MTNTELIKFLAQTNSYEYNLAKTAEEVNELGTVLLQLLNKPNMPKSKQYLENLHVEIADVEIRLKILNHVFDQQTISKNFQKKLDKFKGYVKESKYIGRI